MALPVLTHYSNWASDLGSVRIKTSFHMVVTITLIAEIKFTDRSDPMETTFQR